MAPKKIYHLNVVAPTKRLQFDENGMIKLCHSSHEHPFGCECAVVSRRRNFFTKSSALRVKAQMEECGIPVELIVMDVFPEDPNELNRRQEARVIADKEQVESSVIYLKESIRKLN